MEVVLLIELLAELPVEWLVMYPEQSVERGRLVEVRMGYHLSVNEMFSIGKVTLISISTANIRKMTLIYFQWNRINNENLK